MSFKQMGQVLAGIVLFAAFLNACATQYAPPAVQDESRPYRELYRPFSEEPDPASGSGDVSGNSW